MLEENRKLTEQEIMQVINQLLNNYQQFDLDVTELMQFSGFDEAKATRIVRKRYKDFIIN